MRADLDEIVELFERAKSSVFKLMASVSHAHTSCLAFSNPQDTVPKFIRNSSYAAVLREHDFELSTNHGAISPGPNRNPLSRSNCL